MIHPEIEFDPDADPLSKIQVQKFEVSKVQIRAGNIFPKKLVNILNSLMLLHADRFVVAENETKLQEIWENFMNKKAAYGNHSFASYLLR
jgi:hypothetical protein